VSRKPKAGKLRNGKFMTVVVFFRNFFSVLSALVAVASASHAQTSAIHAIPLGANTSRPLFAASQN